MNRYTCTIFALLASGFFYGNSNAIAATAQPLDRIVAIVNKSVITQSELNDEIDKVKKQLTQAHTSLPSDTVLQQKILDQLIDKTLLLDLAKQTGIHTTDVDITHAIGLISKNNHLTPDELYKEVKKQGITREEYREELQKEIAINRLEQQMVGNRITLSPQELDEFIQSNEKRLDPQHKKEQAQQLLYQQKYEAALKEWMDTLRGQAFINTHLDNH